MTDGEPKRFGPVALSGTDADEGARLYLSPEAIEESGLEPDSAVVLQPYENGIHVVDAGQVPFDNIETEPDDQTVRIRLIELSWEDMQELSIGETRSIDAGDELIIVARDVHADDVVAAFEETLDDVEVIGDA